MTIKYEIQQEPFLWIDFEVNDFNQYKEIVHSWDMDFIQLDKGTFYSEIKQMILPEVHVAHTHFNCHLDQRGHSPEGMWSFVIMAKNSSMYNFNQVLTQSTSTMVIFSPGSEIHSVDIPGFSVYVLSIKEEHLHKLTQELGLDAIKEKLAQIDRVELDPYQADALRIQLKDILDDAASLEHKVITQEGKNLLINFVPMKFLKAIGKQMGCAEDKIMKEKHFFYLEARSYMHTHLHEPLNIDEIAKKFKLSGRSLRSYFQEQLNVSPKQYLIALRLTKIRDELQVSIGGKGSVEKTARRFGFNHMGQFANSYKNFFNELPSETLNTIPKR